MKIGILTFHRAANYGAVLQTFALQKTIEEMGNDVEVIDYACEAVDRMHTPALYKYAGSFKRRLKLLIRYPMRKQKRSLFDKFLNEELYISEKKDICKDKINSAGYDCIITGSDQIWNMNITGNDLTYFLNFAQKDVIKAGYAPSFGVSKLTPEEEKFVKPVLDSYDALSVREQDGYNIVKKLTGKEAEILIDPVFLVSEQKWIEIIPENNYSNYVLLYLLRPSKGLEQKAKELAKEKNCKLITITESMIRTPGRKYIVNASPFEWVSMFKNASYIATNSFHATSFGIIFNKSGVIELSKQPKNGNSRITSLFETLDIDYTQNDNYLFINDSKWEKVNDTIQSEQKKSYDFLRRLCEKY